MRQVKEVSTRDGMRYRVRYRHAGRETSETFTQSADAQTFAAIVGDGAGDRVDQALRWLVAREAESRTNSLTLAQWFAHYVDQLTGVTPRTRSDYQSLYRRYLAHLGATPLPLITRTHVTSLVNEMDRAGRAPKTIKQAVHLLSTCLALAIDEGHLTSNPCRRVRLPSASIEGKKPRFLSVAEYARLLDATPAQYRPLLVFLFGTGMRWSEATAVQTRHVSLAAGTVLVEQAWKRVPGVGFEVGPPKTARANRTVNAATVALAAAQPLLGKPNDFVFTTVSGGPVRHANFYTHVWQPACVKAGLGEHVEVAGGKKQWRGPRIHDARHTHASWLLSQGISIEAVQDQLGHESLETTRKIYAHLIPAIGVAVGKAASAALQEATAASTYVVPELE